MLYDRWCQRIAECRHQTALHELATGRRWTFAQLHAAAERLQLAPGNVVFPGGNSVEFILTLLAAWRENKVVCPLEADQAPPRVEAWPAGCRHLKTTSATTGTPRLVAFTAEQLAADADNIVATMGLRPDWPNLGAISMAHSYGFSNLVLPLLLHGIPLLLAPSALPEAIRRAAAEASALTLPAVPALWRAWHEARAIPSNVQIALSAGAPLPGGLEHAVFDAIGLKIHNFYGSTECGGIAYDTTPTPRPDDTCAGQAMCNVDLSLSEEGCLQVRSAAAGQTYWPEPAPALTAGKFQTSDLAELRDGAVYLRGRLSDLINVAGRKLSPETVEHALASHPQVRECLVFGIPSRDAERTDRVVAVVATTAAEAALRDYLQPLLAAWQIPREWWFVESISANQRGKLSRTLWRQQYLATAAARNGNGTAPKAS